MAISPDPCGAGTSTWAMDLRLMYLPLDQRSIPPLWEPPGSPKRKGDPATILVLLIASKSFIAPIYGRTVFAMVWALCKLK